MTRRSPPLDLERALRDRRVIVCVGAGGVGKTTVAATLALRAAAEGRRAMVLTIDPARRLANALGLERLGNVETEVDLARLRGAGVEPQGRLFATMLDLQRSWDDFIARHVLPGQREALLRNRFYQTLSSALAGSQEYIATERLYEVHSRGDYDLLVLDTPPTSHALDFLDAPRRILDFLDQGSFRAVTGPALAAGRLGLKLMTLGGSVVGKALSRLTGTETLEELTAFMLEIQGTYGVFKDRAAKVKALFASDDAAFVLVTSAHGANVDETIFFHERLAAERIPVAGVVANRVHPDFLEGAPVPDSAALAAALAAAGLDDPGQPPLSERLVQTLAEARAIADADRRSLERLASATRPTPLHRVPRFDSDLYDLPGLWELSRHLFQRG